MANELTHISVFHNGLESCDIANKVTHKSVFPQLLRRI